MSKLSKVIETVEEQFPFDGYMAPWHCAYVEVARTVLRYVPQGGRILDFASGPCDKTAVLQQLGYQCSAYDDLQDDWHGVEGNREKILSYAKETGIEFELANGSPLPFRKGSFDMIMMHDVLEHLHDSPCNLVNDLLELAKPGGLLFVTVPNAVNIRKRISVLRGRTNHPDFDYYYWHPKPWRGHVREYVKDDLARLSRNLNLETLELRSTHHMLQRLPVLVKPLYLALTCVFTGWRDTWRLVARKKNDWSAKRKLRTDEFAHTAALYTSYKY